MSRDGSGIYSLPAGNPVVTGTTISSTTHNTTLTDIANALTASIAKDGQTTPTANLPMGGFKHTGVASGSARNHYASVGQMQDSGFQYVGSVAGTDTITGSLTPAITAYAVGMEVLLSPVNTNTGAVTIALNGLAAKSVYKDNTNRELAAGDLVSGGLYKLYYNGTSFYADISGAEGTFTATLTGVSGSVTGTAQWARNGRVVTVFIPALSGTSNATTMTVTGLPTGLQSSVSTQRVAWSTCTDNGADSTARVDGVIASGSGTITLLANNNASGWTAANTKGFVGTTITYLL